MLKYLAKNKILQKKVFLHNISSNSNKILLTNIFKLKFGTKSFKIQALSKKVKVITSKL